MRRVGVACVVAVLVGCSDEAPVMLPPDAGVDSGPSWRPEPPRIPWLAAGVPPILITPCPPGWREVHDVDVATCDPYPESGPETCAEGFAHFPGGPGCEPVGDLCPTGEWSDGLPADSVLYVRTSAPAGGDGTRVAPFSTIAEAMSRASVGTTVALSRGHWDEVVRMRQGVTLQGACAAGTLLTSSTPSETAGVVNVSVPGTELRNVGIAGASRPGLWVNGAGAELRVDGVVVSGVRMLGVLVAGRARLTGMRLAVRDTLSRETDLMVGRGLGVEGGASATLAHALFDRNREFAVYVGAGTTVQLEDVAVRDTLSRQRDRASGVGMGVGDGASAWVVRGLFERNRAVAINASAAGASAQLEDVVVRDTLSRESDGAGGLGLQIADGASAQVARMLLERSRGVALLADGADTAVLLDDIVVRDTQSRESDGALGRGLVVQAGASAQVERAVIERNRAGAVSANGADTSLTLRDVVIRDTESQQSDERGGRGLAVQAGASADVARALLERNREVGVYVSNAGTRALLEDVVVRDTLAASCGDRCTLGAGGMGVGSYDAATLAMSRFALQRAVLCGAQIASDGELDLSNGEVRESAIGACVQVPGYRLSRLNASVVYVDNGANLEATDFPVPEVSEPVGAL